MYSLDNENDEPNRKQRNNNHVFKTCTDEFLTENKTPDIIKALAAIKTKQVNPISLK